MQENMNISVNGQSQVPPGFRFHPTEEELLQYYLRKKVCYEKIDLDVIRDVDLNKLEPWDIQEKCKIGTTPQNDWYFFSHKDKKYPTGTRTNRATAAGFWKATGRDKVIYGNGKRIGMRKTLVFYKGRAPNGQKSDWIMHEYRLEDNNTTTETSIVTKVMVDGVQEEGWVVCRIYKKKNHLKTLESPLASSITGATRRSHDHDRLFDTCDDDEGALEQILDQMGRSCCKEQIHPVLGGSFGGGDPNFVHYQMEAASSSLNGGLITNWPALDQLVASQLNGQTEASSLLACFNTTLDPSMCYCSSDRDHLQLPNLRSSSSNATQDHYTSEIDPLWNFAPSTSSLFASLEPLCHVSNASSSVAKNVPKSDNSNNNR